MRAFARALGRPVAAAFQYLEEAGLTLTQLRLMHRLLAVDAVSPGHLAEDMRVTPASVTGLTDRLVARGLVARSHDSSDRRVVRLALTEEGRQTLSRVHEIGLHYLNSAFERMAEKDLERLADGLEAFVAASEAVQPSPGGGDAE